MKKIIPIVLLIAAAACSHNNDSKKIVIEEVFQTVRDTTDNVDSPAFWQGTNGENWIISTAKYTDVLIVDDAETGKNIKKVGGEGNGPGQLNRPNGIFVIDDYCFVVERDNRRVQVLTLPDFNSIGIIGDSLLVNPYGIFVYETTSNNFEIYVTDNYETDDGEVPLPNQLNKRIVHFNLTCSDSLFDWCHKNSFGDTAGTGMLNIVESLYGDTLYNNLLIAEEDETQSSVKIYNFDGKFTGKVFGQGLFNGQVEGITLYECNNGKGYWVVTDQSYTENNFLFFDRVTFEYLGSFIGKNTTNTDGIWLTQTPYGKFTKGAFFAVHNDGNVSAFDLAEVLEKLNLECD